MFSSRRKDQTHRTAPTRVLERALFCVSAAVYVVALTGCNSVETKITKEYSPSYVSMDLSRAREVFQASLSSGSVSLNDGDGWTNRINDVRIRRDAVALMYQPRRGDGYAPSTLQTCPFAGLNDDTSVYKYTFIRHAPGTAIATMGNISDNYEIGREWRVNLCRMALSFKNAAEAQRLADALYVLMSSR